MRPAKNAACHLPQRMALTSSPMQVARSTARQLANPSFFPSITFIYHCRAVSVGKKTCKQAISACACRVLNSRGIRQHRWDLRHLIEIQIMLVWSGCHELSPAMA